jgi:hypothetical protein
VKLWSIAFVIVKMYPSEEEIYLPTNIKELSPSELWNATLTATGVENSTANLSYLWLNIREGRAIKSCHFDFLGNSTESDI